MDKVFISYTKKDSEVAHEIFKKLKYMPDIDPWIDDECIEPCRKWEVEIEKAIKESNYFLALLSSESVSHIGYVQKELKIAFDKLDLLPQSEIFIIPVRIEDCKPTDPKLKELYWIDYFSDKSNKDEAIKDEAMGKIMKVIDHSNEYLDRIERAKQIIELIEQITEEIKKNKDDVTIRMRAAFTSMSNIAHYEGKKVPGLFPQQAKKLDELLVKERKRITNLLDMENVTLKCICWPKIEFLKCEFYTKEQKQERIELLKSFLNTSLKNYLNHRQILCDEAGAKGNFLIIGNKPVIVAKPESGGFTKTSILKNKQTIDILIKEFDYLFDLIVKSKNYTTKEACNEIMIHDVFTMINKEILHWKKNLEND